jgi:hypothetical protein
LSVSKSPNHKACYAAQLLGVDCYTADAFAFDVHHKNHYARALTPGSLNACTVWALILALINNLVPVILRTYNGDQLTHDLISFLSSIVCNPDTIPVSLQPLLTLCPMLFDQEYKIGKQRSNHQPRQPKL